MGFGFGFGFGRMGDIEEGGCCEFIGWLLICIY